MMRSDVFTLLSISTNSDFIKVADYSQCIKKWVIKFIEGEFNDRVAKMEIFSRLVGWNKLLHQKCLDN